MSTQSARQIENTRRKLQILEDRLHELDGAGCECPDAGIDQALAQEARQPAQGGDRAVRVARRGRVGSELKWAHGSSSATMHGARKTRTQRVAEDAEDRSHSQAVECKKTPETGDRPPWRIR